LEGVMVFGSSWGARQAMRGPLFKRQVVRKMHHGATARPDCFRNRMYQPFTVQACRHQLIAVRVTWDEPAVAHQQQCPSAEEGGLLGGTHTQ
jgi:hypothetical protein